jgi:hypothetical protein
MSKHTEKPWRLDPEEHDVNGRLIDAAPETYELIERADELMIELDSLRDSAYYGRDTLDRKAQWHKDVAALMAKIEGGEQ